MAKILTNGETNRAAAAAMVRELALLKVTQSHASDREMLKDVRAACDTLVAVSHLLSASLNGLRGGASAANLTRALNVITDALDKHLDLPDVPDLSYSAFLKARNK